MFLQTRDGALGSVLGQRGSQLRPELLQQTGGGLATLGQQLGRSAARLAGTQNASTPGYQVPNGDQIASLCSFFVGIRL